jgi:hypothetical protein
MPEVLVEGIAARGDGAPAWQDVVRQRGCRRHAVAVQGFARQSLVRRVIVTGRRDRPGDELSAPAIAETTSS